MDLLDYRASLITGFATLLPSNKLKVRSHPGRFDLGELKRYAVDAPCLLVALLSWPLINSGLASGEFQIAAYVLTKSVRSLKHDELNLQLASTAMQLLATTGLNSRHCSQIRWDNLYSGALDQEGVSLSAISFRQLLTLDRVEPEAALASFRTLAITWDEGADNTPEALDQLTLTGA